MLPSALSASDQKKKCMRMRSEGLVTTHTPVIIIIINVGAGTSRGI